MKFDLISHWDLDGVCAAIMIAANPDLASKMNQILATGYKSLEKNINKANEPILMVADICLEQHQIDHIAENFQKLIIIDHHQGTPLLKIPEKLDASVFYEDGTSASMMVYNRYKDKFKHDYSWLAEMANDFDTFSLKYEESLWLNELFWDIGWWNFFDAWQFGYDGGYLAKAKKLFDAKVERYKSEEKMVDEDGNMILFDPGLMTHAMYLDNPKNLLCINDTQKISVRSNFVLNNFYERVLGLGEDVIKSVGGHKYAGGIEFNTKITDVIIGQIYELLPESEED